MADTPAATNNNTLPAGLAASMRNANAHTQAAVKNHDIRVETMRFGGISMWLARFPFCSATSYQEFINTGEASVLVEQPLAVQTEFWNCWTRQRSWLNKDALKVTYFSPKGRSLFDTSPLFVAWFVLELYKARNFSISLTTECLVSDWAKNAMKSIASLLAEYHKRHAEIPCPYSRDSLEAQLVAITSAEDKTTDAALLAQGTTLIINLWNRLTQHHIRRKNTETTNKNKEADDNVDNDDVDDDDEEDDDEDARSGDRRGRAQRIWLCSYTKAQTSKLPKHEQLFSFLFVHCTCGAFHPIPMTKSDRLCKFQKSTQAGVEPCNTKFDVKSQRYPLTVYSLWQPDEGADASTYAEMQCCPKYDDLLTCRVVYPKTASAVKLLCSCPGQKSFLQKCNVVSREHTVRSATDFTPIFNAVMTEKFEKYKK
jgi:hypothetical protein